MENKFVGAAITSRRAYNILSENALSDNLSDTGQIVWKLIVQYYEKDLDVSSVDKEILHARIEREYPKHAELLKNSIVYDEELSASNILEEFRLYKRQMLRGDLQQAIDTGVGLEKACSSYLEEQVVLEQEEDNIVLGTDIKQVVLSLTTSNKTKILPKELSESLDGGLIPQSHTVVFAPTEMGKSLFGINFAYAGVKQNLKVLYIPNEDPKIKVLERFQSRCTDMSRQEMSTQLQEFEKRLAESPAESFFLKELFPGSPLQIEALVKKYTPDMLIVDQIRNLEMPADNRTNQLEAAATFMRNMGKKYNLISISLTQGADSCFGKRVLKRGDIDGSNVGIPGQADVMIGIGGTEDDERMNIRYLSVVKNKLSGAHPLIRCQIDPQRSKVL